MKTIAVTIPATKRIDILRTTLRSFNYYILERTVGCDIEYIFYVNIDPVGPDSLDDVKKLVYENVRFPNISCPYEAGFGRAVQSLWGQALGPDPDYVFYLEDDWRLNRYVDLVKLLQLFDKYPELAILRLSAFRSGTERMKIWNKFTDWNGDFFQIPDSERGLLGFAGHPSIIRTDFVKLALTTLDPTRNPEKQLKGRNRVLRPYFESHMFGVYNGQNAPPLVTDTGRKWMVQNGYRKDGSKSHFTQWKKEE